MARRAAAWSGGTAAAGSRDDRLGQPIPAIGRRVILRLASGRSDGKGS